ncbi:TPA: ROK family protein, partial [Klebsiella pneumoniae]|nr:ROK family protein [Klebsiella pneumoniae]
MIYMGVDGGGTKTAFILIDDNGNVLARHESSTCYYL